jgi:hypothetical protein
MTHEVVASLAGSWDVIPFNATWMMFSMNSTLKGTAKYYIKIMDLIHGVFIGCRPLFFHLIIFLFLVIETISQKKKRFNTYKNRS